MSVIRSTDAPTWQLPGTTFTGLVSPSRGGSSEVAIWRLRVAAGTPATAHSVTRTEVFVATAGSAEVRMAGLTESVVAGDTLVVPPDTMFELSTPGDDDFEALVCFPTADKPPCPELNHSPHPGHGESGRTESGFKARWPVIRPGTEFTYWATQINRR